MSEKTIEALFEFLKITGLKIIAVILLLTIGFKLIKLLVRGLKNGKGFCHLDEGVQSFTLGFVSIGLKIIVIITAAGILGLPMTSFITVLGPAGIAIGLALQGSLSNIAGGIIILAFKPFKTGDFISVSDVQGTVREIGIFYTKLRTPDNKTVVMPNGTISAQTLTNISENNIRRIDMTFTAGYECDTKKVKSVLLETAKKHPLVLNEPEPFAGVSSHGENAVKYVLWAWCKCEDYLTALYDLEESVKDEFDKNGISIPYPQLDVNVKNINS